VRDRASSAASALTFPVTAEDLDQEGGKPICMDIEAVAGFLEQYEWSFERVDETILTAPFESADLPFLMVFQLIPPWLRLSVPAYVPLPHDESPSDLLLRALRLNQQTRLVRLAIDERGDLVLCIDLYTERGLTFSEFETALETLYYTAGALYPLLTSPPSEDEPSNSASIEGTDDGEK
jgi:hypothetical protein